MNSGRHAFINPKHCAVLLLGCPENDSIGVTGLSQESVYATGASTAFPEIPKGPTNPGLSEPHPITALCANLSWLCSSDSFSFLFQPAHTNSALYLWTTTSSWFFLGLPQHLLLRPAANLDPRIPPSPLPGDANPLLRSQLFLHSKATSNSVPAPDQCRLPDTRPYPCPHTFRASEEEIIGAVHAEHSLCVALGHLHTLEWDPTGTSGSRRWIDDAPSGGDMGLRNSHTMCA